MCDVTSVEDLQIRVNAAVGRTADGNEDGPVQTTQCPQMCETELTRPQNIPQPGKAPFTLWETNLDESGVTCVYKSWSDSYALFPIRPEMSRPKGSLLGCPAKAWMYNEANPEDKATNYTPTNFCSNMKTTEQGGKWERLTNNDCSFKLGVWDTDQIVGGGCSNCLARTDASDPTNICQGFITSSDGSCSCIKMS